MQEVFRLVLMLVVATFCSNGCSPKADSPDPNSGLPIAIVSVLPAAGGTPVHVRAEVASTSAQRQQGLMFREEMPEDRGMLFLFTSDSRGGFWMKNTILPLTIAYIGVDGTVQELREGVPYDDKTILTPAAPYRYVLEVNKGWFERHNLGVGSKVELPPGLPTPQ